MGSVPQLSRVWTKHWLINSRLYTTEYRGPAAAPALETPRDLNALELDELAEDLTVMGNLLEESTVTKIKV